MRINLQNISGITTENDEKITHNTTVELPMIVKINGEKYLIKSDGSTKVKYGIDEYDISIHPEIYYGKYVTNYNSANDSGIVDEDEQLGKWQIFMADGDYIYLIASNYIIGNHTGKKNNVGFYYEQSTPTKISFLNILNQYNASTITCDIPGILSRLDKQSIYHKWINMPANQTKDYKSEKAVASMLDVDVWSGYNNTTYAKYAIGGPTIEMFCKSYSNSHTENKLESFVVEDGYKIKKGSADPSNSITGIGNKPVNDLVNSLYLKASSAGDMLWLASSAGANNIRYSSSSGAIVEAKYDNATSLSFRPLVCLKSNVHLVEKNNENATTYELELD